MMLPPIGIEKFDSAGLLEEFEERMQRLHSEPIEKPLEIPPTALQDIKQRPPRRYIALYPPRYFGRTFRPLSIDAYLEDGDDEAKEEGSSKGKGKAS